MGRFKRRFHSQTTASKCQVSNHFLVPFILDEPQANLGNSSILKFNSIFYTFLYFWQNLGKAEKRVKSNLTHLFSLNPSIFSINEALFCLNSKIHHQGCVY